jgi:tyrosinase
LFEQIVSKNVFEVAKEYTNASDKERYLDAAKRFRLP